MPVSFEDASILTILTQGLWKPLGSDGTIYYQFLPDGTLLTIQKTPYTVNDGMLQSGVLSARGTIGRQHGVYASAGRRYEGLCPKPQFKRRTAGGIHHANAVADANTHADAHAYAVAFAVSYAYADTHADPVAHAYAVAFAFTNADLVSKRGSQAVDAGNRARQRAV